MNYTLYRKDRESRGGGVLIAVNSLLSCIRIPSPLKLEVVTIKLCLPRNHICICAVYLPPNSDITYFKHLIDFLGSLASREKFLIVIGDFNLPDVCWSSLSGCSQQSNLFCDFLFDSNLSQLITVPTHIKGNTIYFSQIVITLSANYQCQILPLPFPLITL